MAATESDIAAQLIERLLADPAFRDRFRRDPARACHEAGLESLAEEMRLGAGKAMHTLDVRESRSSLAGVMMAAAMEGMGVYEFSKHVVPHIEDLAGSLGDVLSRVNLPALPGGGAMSGGPKASAAPLVEPAEPDAVVADAGGNGGAPAPPAAPLAPEEAGSPGKSGEAGSSAKPGAPAAASQPPAAPELAGADSPGGAKADAAKAEEAADRTGGELRSGTPTGSELPDGAVRLRPSEGGPEAGGDGAAQPAAAPAAAPASEPQPAASSGPVDPSQLGQDGTGGHANAEAQALLKNKNVALDDVGVADIKAGRIDPRIVAVVTKLSQDHKIAVSCMCSDHSKFTAGGSISNHAFGRGLDIASIDGEIVGPGSALAREVASELSQLDPSIRPDEIGSPFAISGPGYFTDAAHQNHIHVGFKQEITPDFKLPAELRAGGAPPEAAAQAGSAPAAAAGTPGAVVDAGAVGPGGGSGSSIGAAALRVAQTQRGVREIGSTNTGPQVDQYLEAAGVPPGNPWCASFLTWSLQQAGHKLPGGGWAAVATWVRNAEQGSNGLKLVSAEEARPGDIAAYDWGGENDFGADGHIGFLDSSVKDGQFTALEGNNADAVNVVPRQLGGANIVFIRVEGDAPAGTAPIDPGQAAAAAGAAAPEAVALGKPERQHASGLFQAAQAADAGKLASAGQPAEAPAVPEPKPGHDSNLFLKAVETKQQQQAQPAQQVAPVSAAAADPGAALDLTGVAGYPGDDAPQEQLAAWMAKEAEKRGLPPQLPVMASLVESGLKNLNFGDADSVGYFQMRVSIWSRDYPGFGDDPQKQIDWFLDTAERVKAQRIARGQPIDDPSQFGEWIADTERPAEQFRGRYQLQLDQANKLLASAPDTPPAPAAPAAPEVAAAPPPPPEAPSTGARQPIDPDQFGQDGTGGTPDAEAQALLKNKNIVLDDVGVADIKAGRIDPRIVAVVTKLSQDHKIVVSCMCSDHPRLTTGGSVSNHNFGRGLDIASIDGEIVSPGSALAREVASQLSQLDPSIRPDEIGSPFAISGPGYFTDADHQNHVHIGFKQEITPDFKLPSELAAGAPPAPPAAGAAAAVAAPAAPAAAAAPLQAAPAPDPKKASGLFAAVEQPARTAAVDGEAPAGGGPAKSSDSNLFLQAVEAKQQPARVAAAPAPVAEPGAPAIDLSAVGAGYPGDDAPKEQLAAWMAKEAEKRGLPPQLPVMASLVESGLKNLNFGDADSVGYFQMRVSIWNQGDYAGYPDDPQKQIDWFLDTAERVKAQRIARGQPIDDPSQFGEWIADTERPAEQFRGRYQLQLDQANKLLASAPDTPPAPAAPAAPEVSAAPPVDPADVAPPAMAQGAGPKAIAALKEAEKYTGTPYRWGGSTPETGFDCSGLVQWAYAQAGVKIPRVTDDQIAAVNGTAVPRAELLPGDLVFFRDASGYVHHVGISMGGDKFLHAPHTGDVVKVSSLDEPYYKAQFTGGRRFDDAAAGTPAPAPAAAPAAPAIDPVAVASAQAAVARDAAEARQKNSGLFMAINAQEARNHAAASATGDRALASAAAEGDGPRDSALFLKAITAEDAAKAKAASDAAGPAAAPTPAAAEPPPAAPPPASSAAPAPPESADATPAGPPPDLSAVPADYPGNDAGQEALAKWLAKQAEKAGLPPELPVMAALVESGVKNLNFGDADSVGFFQMRVSIWNHGEYAGYPENPGLQAKWFIDNALAHKKQQLARGDASFGKDPNAWGEWIADVERPAEQYRGRYQLRLAEARRLLR